jgi:hypothetical protein
MIIINNYVQDIKGNTHVRKKVKVEKKNFHFIKTTQISNLLKAYLVVAIKFDRL